MARAQEAITEVAKSTAGLINNLESREAKPGRVKAGFRLSSSATGAS